jgi:membrane fusion protein, multidrug efflux system
MSRRLLPTIIAALVAPAFLHGLACAEDGGIIPKQRTALDFGRAILLAACSSSALSAPRDGSVGRFHVQAGDQVKKGARLLDFETDSKLVTAYQQAAAILRLAQSTSARTAQLYAQQLATRQDLDNADRVLRDAQMIQSLYEFKGGAKPSETLFAPFDGVVADIPVALGDRLGAGAPLLTLTPRGNCEND